MARILMATMSFDVEQGGGVARLAYDLAVRLTQRGHRITVVCEDLHGRNVEKEIIHGITILRYRLTRFCGLDPWRYKRHLNAITRLLEKYLDSLPDVLHGHSLFQHLGALRYYKGNVQSCYTIHSPYEDELRIVWGNQGVTGKIKSNMGLFIIRELEKECLLHSNILTAESEFTRRLIQSNYGDAYSKRIKVCPGWVDLGRFVPLSDADVKKTRDRLSWPKERPVFFVLRRLEARMGLDNLLRALVLVKRRGFNPYTVIGGNGSLRVSLIRLRDVLGLQNDVKFMGFVPADQVALAYGACDASLIPTAQLECFGIIALEALACGKPTLVTPVGALPEVMRRFESRWIASNGTAEGISDLICAYLGDCLPYHSPEKLRAIIQAFYTVERAVDAYEQILVGKEIYLKNCKMKELI